MRIEVDSWFWILIFWLVNDRENRYHLAPLKVDGKKWIILFVNLQFYSHQVVVHLFGVQRNAQSLVTLVGALAIYLFINLFDCCANLQVFIEDFLAFVFYTISSKLLIDLGLVFTVNVRCDSLWLCDDELQDVVDETFCSKKCFVLFCFHLNFWDNTYTVLPLMMCHKVVSVRILQSVWRGPGKFGVRYRNVVVLPFFCSFCLLFCCYII